MPTMPGDDLVADYLARAGTAAEQRLGSDDAARVIAELERRVVARVGPAPRFDLPGTRRRLAELGDPEDFVEQLQRTPGVLARVPSGMGREGEPAPRPEPKRPTARSMQAEVRTRPGSVPSGTGGLRRRGRWRTRRTAWRAQRAPRRVRPLRAEESVRPDGLEGLSRLGWEAVALVVLGLGGFVFGWVAWAVGAALVARSRFWEILDKVRVLLGVPVAGLVVSVLWAWLSATQIQESNDSGTRVAAAREAFGDCAALMPEVFGLIAAVYLGYALVRDHHTG